MIYLLDVNVLLAVAYRGHDLHERADRWLNDLQQADPKSARFAPAVGVTIV